MTHFQILLSLKGILFRNTVKKLRKQSPIEFAAVIFFFFALALLFYFLFTKAFLFFQNQKPFGPILLDETFYLFNLTLFIMLLISSGISTYASLFHSREVPFLFLRSVSWKDIYRIKLFETLWFSARPFLFILIPFMSAFGAVRGAPLAGFPFLCLAFYLPFILLAVTLGSLAALLCVWLLPTRERRTLALTVILVWIAVFFLRMQPEIVKEQGSLAGILSGYLPHVALAKHPLLPSSWISKGILAFCQTLSYPGMARECLFYFGVLLSNALFFLNPSWTAGQFLFPAAYLHAQNYGRIRTKHKKFTSSSRHWTDAVSLIPRPMAAFMEKDIKTFTRDASEWSQLFVFFGLILLYFLNLRNFQFHVLESQWKNIIFVINAIGVYIVLSSFSMRFVFPMISLEGSRAWLIALAPVSWKALLIEKFVLASMLSAFLSLPLIGLSGWMLEIEITRILFVAGLGVWVCLALSGLSIGLGALFPNFKSMNPSEIISGTGGTLLLVFHLSYLLALGFFLMTGAALQLSWQILLVCASLLCALLPLYAGEKKLKRLEY